MEQNKNYEEMFGQFVDYQQKLHENNQKKIQVGLKVNILLPLVFLIISFITEGSKLVFLILWIVSLFGISFYLLYVEFTDFKLQEKLKEFGVVDEEDEQKALIGQQVVGRIDDFEDFADFEIFEDIKELKAGLASDIQEIKKKLPSKEVAQKADDTEEGDEKDE